MEKLIAVKYVSSTGNPKEKSELHFLDGCLGEAKESDYNRIMKALREEGSKMARSLYISVRFPLSMPTGNVGYYLSWALENEDVAEQGIKVPIRNIRLSKRKIISSYEKKPFPEDPRELIGAFENPVYYETKSQAAFLKAMGFLLDSFKYGWVWNMESRPRNEKPLLFLGARFFGADNLIPIYSPKRFRGLAVQVFTRDILSGYSNPMTSDVLLLTEGDEYVSYIDGIQTNLEQVRNKNKFISDNYGTPYVIPAKEMWKKMKSNKGVK